LRIPPDAIIAPEKLTRYLLVHRPTSDKSKFLALAGFNQSNHLELEAAIRQVTNQNDAQEDRTEEHGTFYNVFGSLSGPNRVALRVKLVWLRRLDGIFSFVTLVPD
jgi:hypothetical protein